MYKISTKEYGKLRDKAKKAQRLDQSEVCGALIETKDKFLYLKFLKNHSNKIGSFEMKISDLQKLRKSFSCSTDRVVGLFHSHPISEALPSKRDIEEAPLNKLMLIYDVCGLEARLYRIIGNKSKKRPKELQFKKC